MERTHVHDAEPPFRSCTMSRWWRKFRKPGGDSRRADARRQTLFRPQLECLEGRIVPAWVTLAAMPTPRSGLAAATGADGRIYAIGGADASGNPLATVEAYNPTTNTWTTAANLNTPRSGLAAVEGTDGRIYVIGGMAASGLTNLVEAYNPATNAWTQVATLPTPRSGLAAATGADGRIYAIGGANASGAALATVE